MFSVSLAARRLGICIKTIRRWDSRGFIHGHRTPIYLDVNFGPTLAYLSPNFAGKKEAIFFVKWVISPGESNIEYQIIIESFSLVDTYTHT